MSRSLFATLALVASLLAFPAAPEAFAASSKGGKAAARKQLKRQLQRDPKAVLKATFIRKAAAVDFSLPIAVRMTAPVNGLAMELDYDPLSAPVLGSQPPATATTTVTGSVGGVARFGADTSGYGDPGTVELLQQDAAPPGQTRLTGTPLALLAGPGCVMNTGPLTFNVRSTYATINFFTGAYRGNLRLVPSFVTTPGPGCATMTSQDPAVAPPLPVALRGHFRISPSILPDGRVRLGLLSADPPQEDSHGELHTNLATLTARVKATSFQAELLLGKA